MGKILDIQFLTGIFNSGRVGARRVYDAHHVYVDKWHGRGGSRGGIHEGLNKLLFLFFSFVCTVVN